MSTTTKRAARKAVLPLIALATMLTMAYVDAASRPQPIAQHAQR